MKEQKPAIPIHLIENNSIAALWNDNWVIMTNLLCYARSSTRAVF